MTMVLIIINNALRVETGLQYLEICIHMHDQSNSAILESLIFFYVCVRDVKQTGKMCRRFFPGFTSNYIYRISIPIGIPLSLFN